MNASRDNSSTVEQPKAKEPQAWKAPLEFAVHALAGTFCFMIIAGVAVGLNMAAQNLESYKIDAEILYGIRAGEYLLFGTDLILFTVFLYRTAARMIKHL